MSEQSPPDQRGFGSPKDDPRAIASAKYLRVNETRQELKKEHADLIREQFKFQVLSIVFGLLVALVFLLFFALGQFENLAIFWSTASKFPSFIIITTVLGILIVLAFAGFVQSARQLFPLNLKIRSIREDIQLIEDELELHSVLELETIDRAEMQFIQHQREVRRYYDTNIGQLRMLLPLGVGIVVAGIAIIVLVIFTFKGSADENLASIIVGCVSGLLVDFIGAVFIKIYTDTIKASTDFHARLAQSNDHLFAYSMVAKIKDADAKHAALADIARIIVDGKATEKKEEKK